MIIRKVNKIFSLVVLGSSLLYSASALAAPGELSDTPLFLANSTKPNVLFVIDDSGSMENEVMLSAGALEDTYYRQHRHSGGANDVNLRYPMLAEVDHNRLFVGSGRNPAWHWASLLRSCHGYNSLAYNPSVIYEPWNGVDVNGVPYTDQVLESARLYPYGRGYDNTNNTDIITSPFPGDHHIQSAGGRGTMQDYYGYIQWIDENEPGFQRGECGETFSETNNVNDVRFNITPLSRTDRFISVADMDAAQRQNFANWFSYYRKRRFALFAPMLDILNDIDMRVGLATINNDGDVAQTVIDIAETDSFGVSNRSTILGRFQQIGGGSSTPLRRPLINAGRYYAGHSVDRNFVDGTGTPGSPIESAANGGVCQQNYTMLLTDGYSNERANDAEGDSVPTALMLAGIGNADGDNNSAFDGGLFADNESNTLGDIAMHYYETDLKPGADYPSVRRSGNQEQHMVTYAVAFGVAGSLSGFPVAAGDVNWPDTNTSDNSIHDFWRGEKQASLDDLMHAAYNGRGEFLSALDPNTLRTNLESVVASIVAASTGTAASASFNSTNISGDTKLFQSSFDTGYWNGTVKAFDYSLAGVAGTASFSTGDVLVERVAANGHGDRAIITYNGSIGVPFRAPNDISNLGSTDMSANQLADLSARAPGGGEQDWVEDTVAFIRGDNSLADGTNFRNRGGFVLGDIAHSSPQVVTTPRENYPNNIANTALVDDNPLYQTYVTSKESRQAVAYVGANDGMLHAFNADDGQELMAYIPSMVFSSNSGEGLHWLTDPNYVHKSYVDSTVTVRDVFVNGTWRTYLVGGLGVGGRGIYVLDVSSPENFSEANARRIVKAEFTHTDLGYTFSRPQIAKLNNDRWAAVFGNGYANDAGDGQAKLFILYLDDFSSLVIDTGAGSIVNADCLDSGSDCNGLSSPSLIDLTGNAVLDRVYAGDLHGNMWAFDLSATDSSNWGIAHSNLLNRPEPLFTACSTTPCTPATRQPITAEPVVAPHTSERASSTSPNTFVMFGTGQLITAEDTISSSQQSFYGVWDAGSSHGGLMAADLQSQLITTVGGERRLSSNDVSYSTGVNGNFGWVMALPTSGERVVITPKIGGEIVLFTTSIPDGSPCGSGGSGYLMAAEIFSGTAPNFDVFGDPGKVAEGIPVLPVGFSIIDRQAEIPGENGGLNSIPANFTGPRRSGRVNWSVLH